MEQVGVYMERGEDDRSYRRLAAAVIVDAVQDYTEARLTHAGLGSSRIVAEVDRKSAERGKRVDRAGRGPQPAWTRLSR